MTCSAIIRGVQGFFGLGASIQEQALVSLILTMTAMFSWIIIGFVFLFAERLELCILRKIFGWNFAHVFHNLITFPGLIMHEIAHAAFGLFTGAKITEISVTDSGSYIGHIRYINRGPQALQAVQDTLISCAPTVVGFVLSIYLLKAIAGGTLPLWTSILFGYFEMCILNHISMSDVDITLYLRGIWVFILPTFILMMTLCLKANGTF